jgi:hypothetical protein
LRAREPIEAALKQLGLRSEFRRIRKPGFRRPWSCLSIGPLVSREQYGEQTKRWYARGLPPAEKQSWIVDRIPYEKAYDWRSSPRAWLEHDLILVPPEIWKDANRDRRKLFNLMRLSATPEMAEVIAQLIRTTAGKLQSSATGAPPGALSRETVLAHYEAMRARRQTVIVEAAQAATAAPTRPPSEGGRYASSQHTESSEPRELRSDQDLARAGPRGRPAWMGKRA